MSDDSLVAALGAIIALPADQITDATEIVPAEWDSIQILDLIAAIDESHGVTVATADMTKCRTVGELRALIGAAVAQR